MSSPLISVIIPVYNVEKYLHECIDSIINQTYKNVELIAINDGSTDRSLEILESYAIKWSFIKVINQENSGQSVARNKGLEYAEGKYIYFLDSDDYILPNTFERLIDQLEKNNIDLIRFAARPFSDSINKKIDQNEYDFHNIFEAHEIYNKKNFLLHNINAFSPAPVLYLFKKEILDKNNILFHPGIIHEDELFTLELFLNTNRMMYDPSKYYQRRFRENSTMTSKQNLKRSFDAYCVVLKESIALLVDYKNIYERKLINSRIYKLTGRLVYNDEIERRYKIQKLSELNILFKPQTILFFTKRNIRKILK